MSSASAGAPLLASAGSSGIGAALVLPLDGGGTATLHADGGATFASGPPAAGAATCCGLASPSRWDAPPATLVGVEVVGGGAADGHPTAFRFLAARPVGRALTSLGGRRRVVDASPVMTASSPSLAPPFIAAVRAAVTRGWAGRPRAVLAVLNPASGRRRAGRVWARTVAPLLAAAGIASTVVTTTRPGHAADLAEATRPEEFGALAGVGGDGTAAELIDGLMRRPDWAAAGAALPLCQVPAGSGNALAANAGTPGCAVSAALALVRGVAAPLDVGVAVEGGPGGRRTHAFLSLSTGLVANADVGTDHLRCLGPVRFTLGALWEALRRRAHPMEVWIVPPGDAGDGEAAPAPAPRPGPPAPLAEAAAAAAAGALPDGPPARTPLAPPWTRLPTGDGVSMLVACNLPLLDASTHMAPSAGRGTGRLEIVAAGGRLPWGTALALLAGVASGAHAAHPAVTCTPAAAVLVRLGGRGTCLALDGERVRGGCVALQCVPGAARVMVLAE